MVKKVLKWTIIILFVAFAGIQFVRPNYSNPPVSEANRLESTTQVPDDVKQIFARACNDCHTNETRWPWYSNIAPLSWSIVNHVDEGRRHLNFSEWNTYDLRKKTSKLDEVCDEMVDKLMPHDQYLWLHPEAKVSAEDIRRVCEWTEAESERLSPSKPE